MYFGVKDWFLVAMLVPKSRLDLSWLNLFKLDVSSSPACGNVYFQALPYCLILWDDNVERLNSCTCFQWTAVLPFWHYWEFQYQSRIHFSNSTNWTKNQSNKEYGILDFTKMQQHNSYFSDFLKKHTSTYVICIMKNLWIVFTLMKIYWLENCLSVWERQAPWNGHIDLCYLPNFSFWSVKS